MNDDIKNLAESLRPQLQDTRESADTTDLHLTRTEFMHKMLQEPGGQKLLDLLENGEWSICERLGLSNAYVQDGTAYIDVPRWKNLVAHLRIVDSV